MTISYKCFVNMLKIYNIVNFFHMKIYSRGRSKRTLADLFLFLNKMDVCNFANTPFVWNKNLAELSEKLLYIFTFALWKNCQIFQTANRFLSDKLLGTCRTFFCFEPSQHIKVFFIKKAKTFFFFFHLTFFMNMWIFSLPLYI